MLNRIILMGRLTRDPELRRTQGGTAVANFSLAVERDFKDQATGEKATGFIDIVAWRSTAELAEKYFHKGRMAVVQGRRGGGRAYVFCRLQAEGQRGGGQRPWRRIYHAACQWRVPGYAG